MTYSSKTTHKTQNTNTPREVSPAGFPILTADDMEKNGLIDCAPQRARLAQLHNSAAMAGIDGPVDPQGKLTAAISATLKGLETIESINAKRREAAAKKGISDVKNGITDEEFDADIQALCALLEKVPMEAYKPGTKYGPPLPSSSTAETPKKPER